MYKQLMDHYNIIVDTESASYFLCHVNANRYYY